MAIKTTCTGCGEDTAINRAELTVKASGKEAPAVEYDGTIEWECPACGYAESFHPAQVEEA